MNFIKSILGLQFSTAARPWLEMREILRVAGGNPAAELQASPVVLDQPDKRQRVILQVRAVAFEQEGTKTVDDSVAQALDIMTRLNDASEFPLIRQIHYESVFIEPYSLPFHELVAVMKDRFLQGNAVVESATDVGLVFDQHEHERVKHTTIGPMDAEQLRSQYLRWPQEHVPDTFVFFGLRYEWNTEARFERRSLEDFLRTAVAWQSDQAAIVLKIIEGDGG